MGVDHLGRGLEVDGLMRAVRQTAVATIQNAAVGRAGIRVYDGGWIRIEGGGLSVTGTQTVTGTLTGTGTFDWYGPSIIRGTFNVTGNSAFSGTMWIGGATTLAANLNVAGGSITVGNIVIDQGAGGRIAAPTLRLEAGTVQATGHVLANGGVTAFGIHSLGNLSALGDMSVMGTKSFKIPHPQKPGHWLLHGSTESPVSGIEYWGDETLGDDGTLTIELPEYFEALAKPEGRTVLVTGRGHSPDWSDVEDGRFTVTGTPGGRFSWLVKAERFGGDFDVVQEMTEEDIAMLAERDARQEET